MARAVLLSIVSHSLYGLSVYGDTVLSDTCYIFFAINSHHFCSQVTTHFTFISDCFVKHLL